MSIQTRIREERKRLRLTQAEFAALVGTTQRTVMGWESNRSYPDARILEAWHAAGVDAGYIVTGVRTDRTLHTSSLTVREIDLINYFRQIDENCKRAVEGAAIAAFCSNHNFPAPRLSASAVLSVALEPAASENIKAS